MGDLRAYVGLTISRSCLEYFEIFLQVFVQFHDGGYISTTVVVIWSRPHRDQFFIKHVLVPLHHQLVGSCH